MDAVRRRPLAGACGEIRSLLARDFPRNPAPSARITLAVLRAGMVLYRHGGLRAFLLRRLIQVADAVWVRGLMGTEIPTCVMIGPGLRLPHGGRGIAIHPTVRIGSGVTLYRNVSIGVKDSRGGPTIGDDVEIGTGAVILGPVTVADRCRIGANAVLTRDTQPGRNYAGAPAVATTDRRR